MKNDEKQINNKKTNYNIYFQKAKEFLTREHIKTLSIIFLVFLLFCFIFSDPEQENIRLSSKILGLESTSTNLQQTIDKDNNQIEALQQENNNLKSKISELETKVSQSEQDKKTLENNNSELNTKINQLQQDLNSKTEQLERTTKTSSTSSSTTSSSKRSSNTSNSANTQSKTVYITNTGSKYHSSGCSYLSRSKIAISLNNAKDQGYTACSRCNP